MRTSLRKLEIFAKVAETEHVTKASELLLLSQSAVSMALADLERQAGSPLFQRQGRRLFLNDRGRGLLAAAQQVLTQLDNFEKLLDESAEEPIGELIIGASTTIGNYLLPALMATFSQRYPRAKALLQVGNTQQIETALEQGDIDLGLIEGPCHSQALDRLHWRNDELVVIAGKNHPWSKTEQIDRTQLKNADWIVREKGSGTREVFETAMSETVQSYLTVLELGHTEAIKKAVEAGLGVSCLSLLAVERELQQGWLVAVKTPLRLSRPLTILLRKNCYQSKLLNSCLELLQSAPASTAN